MERGNEGKRGVGACKLRGSLLSFKLAIEEGLRSSNVLCPK